MSIASELTNLESNIGDAYDAVNDMSGIIPQHKNMANLDQAIRTIPQNAGTTYTAGNGINIDANNEISIDDTVVAELSDLPGVMTGASSSVAGASGLVPAPAIGDQNKVLKGDGTWGAVDAATTTFYVDNLAAGTRTIYSDRDFTNAVSGNTIKTAFENGRVRVMYTPMSLFSYDEYEVVGIGDIHDTPTAGGTFILSGANNTISLCYSYQSFANTSATLTKKTIPTVNDGTLTIQHNGATIQTFTANQFSAATANIETIWADDAIPATQVPPVTTSMIANGAVTSEKINAGTATSNSGSLLLGSILIQWGVEDYGNLTYGNDWFGLKRPSSECAAIQFPTAFSSAPYVMLCPDTYPIIHCTPYPTTSVHTATQTYSFYPICPPNGSGTYATKIKWIAIGEA